MNLLGKSTISNLPHKKTKVFERPWFLLRAGRTLLQESDLTEEGKGEDWHESEEERHRRLFTLGLLGCDLRAILTGGTSTRSLHDGLALHLLHRSMFMLIIYKNDLSKEKKRMTWVTRFLHFNKLSILSFLGKVKGEEDTCIEKLGALYFSCTWGGGKKSGRIKSLSILYASQHIS